MSKHLETPKPSSLYLHIPFCHQVCHYCDFAKTANFTDQKTKRYLEQLVSHADYWLQRYQPQLQTVFLGGGTPSLFAAELAPLIQSVRPFLAADAELTIEANPEDLASEQVRQWEALGFNRLSIGVQTFSPEGLRFLTRTHTEDDVIAGVRCARPHMASTSLDLIYGWPGQTVAMLERDIDLALSLKPDHLSFYTLTYEPRTVIGRRAHRGAIKPCDDDTLADMYERLCTRLAKAGFEHYEVSNWARAGHECQHNRAYWEGRYYLGIGLGAHAYLPEQNIGRRLAYPDTMHRFLTTEPPVFIEDAMIVDERSTSDWLLEMISVGLRSRIGFHLDHAAAIGHTFQPTRLVEEGIKKGLMTVCDNTLSLVPSEWFREQAWTQAVFASIHPAAPTRL